MLVTAEDPLKVIERVIDDPGLSFIARNLVTPPWKDEVNRRPFLRRKLQKVLGAPERRVKPKLFINAEKRNLSLAIQRGADFFIFARSKNGYRQILEDLFFCRFEKVNDFLSDDIRDIWQMYNEGKPYIFVHSPYQAWKCGVEVGFKPSFPKDWDEKKIRRKMRMGDARTWYVTGKPRFKKRIKHFCRVIERSDELLPLIIKGVEYGEGAKDYLRACLLLGPSFVCEVDGKPVCWSGTHLSGTMGMIYTPPEHRRKGYAESLSAFQIDYMLEHYRIAVAHVVYGNRASERLLQSFGAVHSPGTITWRTLNWPKRMWKRLEV